MSITGEEISQKDINRLISFWEGILAQYQFIMGISQQVLVKETIDILKQIKVKQK